MNNPSVTENELMAVISAAVASMNTRAGYKLVVKSLRRTSQTAPVWNTAGRIELVRGNANF